MSIVPDAPIDAQMSEMTQVADRFVVVSDIVGSTRLYDELGDDRAKRLVTDRVTRMSRIVNDNHGVVGATAGDEVLATFDGGGNAAAAACEMQLDVQQHSSGAALGEATMELARSVRLRIGIHFGSIIADPLDLASETIAIARRLSSLAKAEQTLLSREVLDRLPPIYRAMTRYVDDEPWRGATTTRLQVHELIWEVEGLTAHSPMTAAPQTHGYARVTLATEDRTVTVDHDLPEVTVGRSNHNDLVVDFDLVSREHFRITLRHGRCTLTDASTNGTWIVAEDGEETLVTREAFPLRGAGHLYFGKPSAEGAAHAVAFRCE
jgi:class 3 adenylate cyclase